MAASASTFQARAPARRSGPGATGIQFGLEHFGFDSEDIDADIARLKRLGVKLLERPIQMPTGAGPFPTVLVIHENRGLNPYIEDVARRAATEGFVIALQLIAILDPSATHASWFTDINVMWRMRALAVADCAARQFTNALPRAAHRRRSQAIAAPTVRVPANAGP